MHDLSRQSPPLPSADCVGTQDAVITPIDQVHLVEEHGGDRDAVGMLLAERGYPTRVWVSITDFLDEMPQSATGCVLIDWCHPSTRNPVLRKRLTDLPRRHSTIVLTRCCDVASAIGAMKAGVLDVLEKPVDAPALFAAIEQAFAHGRDRRSQAAADLDARARIAALSGRELEVLVGLIAGGSNKSLARSMAISARTVEIHRARMMAKLGTASLAQAIRLALKAGLA